MMAYRSSLLSAVPGVEHGFGTRGVALHEHVRALGDGARRWGETRQVHGAHVHRWRRPLPEEAIAADAFATTEPGIVCSVRTADCVPILIAERRGCAVAAVHAGWRGTAQRVAVAAVRAVCAACDVDPRGIVAAIGPAICGACYDVGPEVVAALGASVSGSAAEGWGQRRSDARFVDVAEVNRLQLLECGLAADAIDRLPLCTACGGAPLASWRREQTPERQVNFIVRRGESPAAALPGVG